MTPNLDELIELFHADRDALGDFTPVAGESMPATFRELLDHHSHMTVTVERVHESLVDVEVIESRLDGDAYSRQILLKKQRDGRVVQFGIVRLDLSVLSPEVRDEIRSQRTPLGRILIEHQVMRQVQLAALWRIRPSTRLSTWLPTNEDTIYGRTAMIYCDDQPAVELLEIVVGK